MRFWTLKESFAKAVGIGFSLPFLEFSFSLSASDHPEVRISPERPEADSAWSARLFEQVAHDYMIAACWEKRQASDTPVTIHPVDELFSRDGE